MKKKKKPVCDPFSFCLLCVAEPWCRRKDFLSYVCKNHRKLLWTSTEQHFKWLLWLFTFNWQFSVFYLCVISLNVKSLTSVAQCFIKIDSTLLRISQIVSLELFLVIALQLKPLSKILTLLSEHFWCSGLARTILIKVCTTHTYSCIDREQEEKKQRGHQRKTAPLDSLFILYSTVLCSNLDYIT